MLRLAALLAALLTGTIGLLAGVPAPARAASVDVTIGDGGFNPGSVTVQPGDRVVFTWTGDGQHGVRSSRFDSHPACSSLTPGGCGGPGSQYAWDVTGPTGSVPVNDPATGFAMTILIEEAAPEPTDEPSPSPTPSPSASPEPTPSASPEPSATPEPSGSPEPSSSPEPTASDPSPSPAPTPTGDPGGDPSPSPSPSPSPTFTFQPPAPRETAPPVVVEPTASDAPSATPTRGRPSLEPFPSPGAGRPGGGGASPAADGGAQGGRTDDNQASPGTSASDQDLLGLVELPSDPNRPVAIGLAVTALGVTAIAFGRLVLFGPPWT